MLIIAILIALMCGVILGVTVAMAVQEYFRLRRALKTAQEALQAQETAPQPSIKEVQKRVDEIAWNAPPGFHYEHGRHGGTILIPDTPPPVPGFAMGAIGPSATQSREIYEREKQKRDTTPPFASPRTLNPDLKDIQDAAREATGTVN